MNLEMKLHQSFNKINSTQRLQAKKNILSQKAFTYTNTNIYTYIHILKDK